MKTYLNRKDKYVNEEPEDGYFICKDRSGLNVYSGDRFIYSFQNKLSIDTAFDHNIYWIQQGMLLEKNEILGDNDEKTLNINLLQTDGFRDVFVKKWFESNATFTSVYVDTLKELKII